MPAWSSYHLRDQVLQAGIVFEDQKTRRASKVRGIGRLVYGIFRNAMRRG